MTLETLLMVILGGLFLIWMLTKSWSQDEEDSLNASCDDEDDWPNTGASPVG